MNHPSRWTCASLLLLFLFFFLPDVSSQGSKASEIEEIVVAQGLGGNLTDVHIINIDPSVVIGNYYSNFLRIHQAFKAMPDNFLLKLGGGRKRATYLSVGDVNGDGEPDIVNTFGPIVEKAVYPNMVMVRNPKTKDVIGHPFQAFPSDRPASEINYTAGEIRTAVGDFIRSGRQQIAAAQGYGGKGYVRLYEYTGQPAPYGWRVVGQFLGLEDLAPNYAYTDNANGGVTLAAGDVDNDGVDELIVGQSNSKTSLSYFQVLDIQETRGTGVADVARRVEGIAFPGLFAGQGGIELAVGDLNGDSRQEILAASQGNPRDYGDWRDFMPGNLVAVLCPVVENQTVVGFQRPDKQPLLRVMNSDSNPSGAVQITAGEFLKRHEGEEFAVSTGSLYDHQGESVTPVLPAPGAWYAIYWLNLETNQGQPSINDLAGWAGWPAYLNETIPESGAVSIGSGNLY